MMLESLCVCKDSLAWICGVCTCDVCGARVMCIYKYCVASVMCVYVYLPAILTGNGKIPNM